MLQRSKTSNTRNLTKVFDKVKNWVFYPFRFFTMSVTNIQLWVCKAWNHTIVRYSKYYYIPKKIPNDFDWRTRAMFSAYCTDSSANCMEFRRTTSFWIAKSLAAILSATESDKLVKWWHVCRCHCTNCLKDNYIIYLWSVTFLEQILRIIIKIFVRYAESKSEKWRRIHVNVNIYLLTSYLIPNVIFTFATLDIVLRCMKTPNGIIPNLKQFLGWDTDIIAWFLMLIVRMKLDDYYKWHMIKRLLHVYGEIYGPRSYGGDALTSSCVFRHMNSCRILRNINSITYNYVHWSSWIFDHTMHFADSITMTYAMFEICKTQEQQHVYKRSRFDFTFRAHPVNIRLEERTSDKLMLFDSTH